jgi:hypothetical protein
MKVEIGTEAAQFPGKGIHEWDFLSLQCVHWRHQSICRRPFKKGKQMGSAAFSVPFWRHVVNFV